MSNTEVTIYPDYTALVSGDPLDVLGRQAVDFPTFIRSVSDKADYAYAPGKWTIKEVAGHMIDTERVLVYRLTALARGDQQPLPPFDENAYVAQAAFSKRDLESLLEEFTQLRRANMYLFSSLTEEDLSRSGIVSGKPRTAYEILLTIAGHVIHHEQVIRERYLQVI